MLDIFYYERVQRICEQVVKYFLILHLDIYTEFADFITAGKIFHNLGALFRIDVPHILLVWLWDRKYDMDSLHFAECEFLRKYSRK